MKTHEIFVTLQFVTGTLKGVTLQDHHYFGIVESSIPYYMALMQNHVDNEQIIGSRTESQYVIKSFEIREIGKTHMAN